MISVLSTCTHLSTILVLVGDFKRDWTLRWMRGVLMFVNLALSCYMGISVLHSVRIDLPSTIPIGCISVLPDDHKAAGNAASSIAGTIGVIAGNCVVFIAGVWYIRSRSQRYLAWVQIVGLLFLAALAVAAVVKVLGMSQAFGRPSVQLSNHAEREWSTGQILSVLPLVFPLITVFEMIRGKERVCVPVFSKVMLTCLRRYEGSAGDM
jgi:hypothetical protein